MADRENNLSVTQAQALRKSLLVSTSLRSMWFEVETNKFPLASIASPNGV